ncbi:MAG TPA: xanthine dehydrogenase family protein molybdopterin-binding subunit [Streptosporangiaceae bacterium]|nr:xanthine dehydrogenase family protein molybdopterin-binding subunit [Streptosporangiaceae bacterium]
MSILGTRVVRTEDPRLLTAGGTYTDDLRLPELAGAGRITFVRSPMAHARITGIDTSAARKAPGVIAVLTASDLDDVPSAGDNPTAEPLLAAGRVRYVGEAVAIVVTEDSYQGEDAAELVSVDYEPLPAVVTIGDALAGSTLLFDGTGSNLAAAGGDPAPDDAFSGCDVVIERRIVNQRLAPVPLEVRAAAARWADGRLTLWVSTQNAQLARGALAGSLGLPEAAIRVIAPDVGGGFGAKIAAERDSIAVAWAAKRLSRPLRWVETRNENLMGMVHGRAQQHIIKIGGTRDGRIRAYHLDLVQDCGAYPRFGPFLATLTKLMASGVYDIGYAGATFRAVVTTTTPVSAYRGAGRPEATAAIERAVDLFAAEIGMDPVEVRRRNVVPPDAFPYTTQSGAVYDSGDYAAALDKVLAAAGYAGLRAEQARRRERGDPAQLGIGVSCYVEITAGDAPLGETSRLVVDATGAATVYTGSSAHGQGHQTAFAMLVSDELGIPMDRITVIHGDTDAVPKGVGTYASRSLQLGGSAVHQAAVEVKDKARDLAAGMIEASEADLEFDVSRGAWQVRGDPETALTLAAIAERAGPDGLVADVDFRPDSPTFPFGAHVAVVEVDTETGKATLIRHVTVDDAGKVLNPVLAEGQRHGGIAQGVAQALLEEMLYDADGNPLTATLADYSAITATELPSFELIGMETPTTVNPLGVKGIGEAGTIGAAPAVQSAVIDAVAHLGVRHIDMPATPVRVWTAIRECYSEPTSEPGPSDPGERSVQMAPAGPSRVSE